MQVDCKPNLVVYHALIAALGRAGRWEEALAMYEERLRAEEAEVSPTLSTLSILFDCCLGQDGAEAALAAVGGLKEGEEAAASFSHAGATAAKGLYRQAVADGMMDHACAAGVTSGESSLRVDIRMHTRSAAIVALLCVLDDLQQANADGARLLPRSPSHCHTPPTSHCTRRRCRHECRWSSCRVSCEHSHALLVISSACALSIRTAATDAPTVNVCGRGVDADGAGDDDGWQGAQHGGGARAAVQAAADGTGAVGRHARALQAALHAHRAGARGGQARARRVAHPQAVKRAQAHAPLAVLVLSHPTLAS